MTQSLKCVDISTSNGTRVLHQHQPRYQGSIYQIGGGVGVSGSLRIGTCWVSGFTLNGVNQMDKLRAWCLHFRGRRHLQLSQPLIMLITNSICEKGTTSVLLYYTYTHSPMFESNTHTHTHTHTNESHLRDVNTKTHTHTHTNTHTHTHTN
eukprot:GHVR01046833.1.p1 GENE.GHVR01046833.1~~GHVR01046833.1.p1  ORF type:complete len:151 (+),score=60.96 GHVR01046833.1:30-482(+)